MTLTGHLLNLGPRLMGTTTITFSRLVDKLHRHYGASAPPFSTDPLELVIWENIAYLASDERRAEAFANLKENIGTRPEQILAAKHSALAAIGKAGILPDVSAEKLLTAGELQVKLDTTLNKAGEVIRALPARRLTETIMVQHQQKAVLELIYTVVEHFAQHTGQIIFVTKTLTGEDLGYRRPRGNERSCLIRSHGASEGFCGLYNAVRSTHVEIS